MTMGDLDVQEIADALLPLLRKLHADIRTAVCRAFETEHDMADVADDGPGDTIYAVDKISEALLMSGLGPVAERWPLRLVAEGVHGANGERSVVLPLGTTAQPVLCIIVDPIDGTRGLMYQKRPAWVLTGVALQGDQPPRLSDVFLALQTELPLQKQHLADQLWATNIANTKQWGGERLNLITQTPQPLACAPSRARTLAHGFATVCRFFPGARDLLGTLDERLMASVLGANQPGKALAFEDQYASTGGQIYELIMGHDRFVADLRPLVSQAMIDRGQPAPLCCHPYDVCTALIAQAAGVVITNPTGGLLDPGLDLDTDVAWVGYANAHLQDAIAPALQQVLSEMNFAEVNAP